MISVTGDSEAEAENETKVQSNQMIEEDQTVVDSYNFAQNYAEDSKKHLWCEITFAVSIFYST